MSANKISQSSTSGPNIVIDFSDVGAKNEILNRVFNTPTERKNVILIIVATMVELKQLQICLKGFGYIYEMITTEIMSYFRVVLNNPIELCFVKCRAGTTGQGASVGTLNDAILLLKPTLVIMGGIAFGVKGGKRGIGDVLVSAQIWDYEMCKVSDKLIPRGDKSSASPRILQIFEMTASEWVTSEIHFGLIASGNKLVNSMEFIELLRQQEPDIIGGEMEGTGLMSVCGRNKVDWILIKGICDWGYGKTDDFQVQAAANAMEFIITSLKKAYKF